MVHFWTQGLSRAAELRDGWAVWYARSNSVEQAAGRTLFYPTMTSHQTLSIPQSGVQEQELHACSKAKVFAKSRLVRIISAAQRRTKYNTKSIEKRSHRPGEPASTIHFASDVYADDHPRPP